jgi:hypothetical protein
MSFIDWSDSEEMLSLLLEYVEDERNCAQADKRRHRFLSGLVGELSELEMRIATVPGPERVELLRSIVATVDEEYADDPVVEHLAACLVELERIDNRRGDGSVG